MGAVSDMLLDRLEVDQFSPGSIRSEQSAFVSSHQPHSARLGTRLDGISDTIFRMNSASRATKALSTLSAGICFSLPSAYTTTPSNFFPDQRSICDLGKRYM